MPYETFSSGLTIQAPTAGTKNWAETLRTQLFAKISAHDHTGSGKGLQIATAALATNAVTTVKITDLNVTTAKINDLAVTTAKLADGAVTSAKLASGTFAFPFAVFLDINITAPSVNLYLPYAHSETITVVAADNSRFYFARAGTLTHASAVVKDGVSETKTFTIFKNGSTTSVSFDLTGTDVAGAGALSSPIAVAEDDYIEIKFTSANATRAKFTLWGT